MKRQAGYRVFFFAGILLMAWAIPAFAADGPDLAASDTGNSGLSELYALIAYGVEHNPELERMRADSGVLEARTTQAGLKSDPKLSIALANFPAPSFQLDETPMTQAVIGWSRSYESHGKRKLKKRLAAFDEKLLLHEIALTEWELAEEISDKYFAISRARARLAVLDENIKLVELINRTVEGKYGIGLTPQSEVLRAQLQLTRLESARVLEMRKIETAGAMLAGLLGNPADFDVTRIGHVDSTDTGSAAPEDADALVGLAMDRRPDFARLRLMLEKKDVAVTLAERASKRDYTLNASYGARWGKRDFVSVGIAFPLFTSKSERQDSLVEEKALEGVALSRQLDAMRNTLKTRVETDLAGLKRLDELIDLYSEGFIPQAELALESHIAGFGAEGAQFESLLKTQELLFDLRTELELMSLDRQELLIDLQLATAGGFDPANAAREINDD